MKNKEKMYLRLFWSNNDFCILKLWWNHWSVSEKKYERNYYQFINLSSHGSLNLDSQRYTINLFSKEVNYHIKENWSYLILYSLHILNVKDGKDFFSLYILLGIVINFNISWSLVAYFLVSNVTTISKVIDSMILLIIN